MALSSSDIRKAAESIGVELCAIKAVVDVESNGSGFLPDGRAKILFEGHIFWQQLQKHGIDPIPYAAKYPNIIYPKFDKFQYRGGTAEWGRLSLASQINEPAAYSSASYGLFQIMGFNYAAAGFPSVRSFVDAQGKSEAEQLAAFCTFIRSEGLIPFLAGKDWTGFARRYNGPAYAENQYDIKLKRAYERCKAAA